MTPIVNLTFWSSTEDRKGKEENEQNQVIRSPFEWIPASGMVQWNPYLKLEVHP